MLRPVDLRSRSWAFKVGGWLLATGIVFLVFSTLPAWIASLLGRSHVGDSGWLEAEDIAKWRIGDRGTIAYDPERPEISVRIG